MIQTVHPWGACGDEPYRDGWRLETFDGFIRRLQGKAGPTLVAEARLRPLTNPMKMNGCAMVVLNPPPGAEAAALEICNWVASTLGDPGARAEVWSVP